MRKQFTLLLVPLLLFVSVPAVIAADDAGGVLPATMEKYQKARELVGKFSGTKAEKLAPEAVEEARKSLTSAQNGLKAGNDKATRESTEMALLQATLATVLADEREAAQKTGIVRKDLDALEKRLAAILTGKGEGK